MTRNRYNFFFCQIPIRPLAFSYMEAEYSVGILSGYYNSIVFVEMGLISDGQWTHNDESQ